MSTDTTLDDDAQPVTADEILRSVLGDSAELAVLDALIQHENEMSGRQIAEAASIESGRLQMALPHLHRQGVLQVSDIGGTTYWGLDRDSRIVKRLIPLWTTCRREVDR